MEILYQNLLDIEFQQIIMWLIGGGLIYLAIAKEMGVPVKFVGLGEGIDDLQPFDAVAFAEALV